MTFLFDKACNQPDFTGFYYTVDLTVSESNCDLKDAFDPSVCVGNRKD